MRARVYDRDHLDHYDLDLHVDDVALPRAAGRRTAMPRTSTDRWTSCSLSDCAEGGRPPVATIILVLENDDQRGMANVKVFCDCDDVTIEIAPTPPPNGQGHDKNADSTTRSSPNPDSTASSCR